MLIFHFYQTGFITVARLRRSQGYGNDPEHWDRYTGKSGDMAEDDDDFLFLGIRSNVTLFTPETTFCIGGKYVCSSHTSS